MAVIETQGFRLDNSGRRVVVDPITRIEGHLRIEVNVDQKNVITNAVSTGTMWRGLEVILKGRDPRDAWAFTERICGVCTGVHAVASVRAVENATRIAPFSKISSRCTPLQTVTKSPVRREFVMKLIISISQPGRSIEPLSRVRGAPAPSASIR